MNKRQAQKQATADKIYRAAIGLFLAQGYEATSVEQITQAAGVAKGTFFAHFASKDALITRIGRMQMDRIMAAIAAEPEFFTRPLASQLRQIYLTLAAGISDQPREQRMLAEEILRRALLDTEASGIDALDALLRDLLRTAQQRGELAADLQLDDAVVLLRGSYFQAVFSWLQGRGQLDQLAVRYLDLLLSGLIAPR